MLVSWLLALLLLPLHAPQHHPHAHHPHGRTPAPAFADCAPGNSYTVPAAAGVIYDVMEGAGVFRAEVAGTYPAPIGGGRVEVEALTGAPEAPATRQLGDWTHTFGAC